MPCPRPSNASTRQCFRGTTIAEAAAADLDAKLHEVVRRAFGPVLYVADAPGDGLDEVGRQVREHGRRHPLIACYRDAGPGPSDAIQLEGRPVDEIRGLPMRFGAVVIAAAGSPGDVEEELSALSGKLLPGATVLVLDAFAGDAQWPPFGLGKLRLSERVGAAALLLAPEQRRPARPRSALAASLAARVEERPRTPGLDSPVTVVIAIHNAFEELARCIDSVLATTPEPHQVLLVDDASTDERVAPLLVSYARRSARVTVLTNPENRGYTATINRGCEWAEGDVVLLNSDTEVASGWLEGLQAVARSRRDVATVTPVSNSAGAFSLPERNVDTPLPEGVSVAEMAALVARLSSRRRPVTPTGNGFCMYVSRAALDRIGGFDEETFPRGYGEENDFSQRAEAAGLVNLIDDATFVYHKRSASFGEHKADLIAAAKERLRAKHPGYPDAVKAFLADDPLSELRRAVAGAVRRGPAEIRRLPRSRATVLLVLHAGGGGTPETNRDLARSLSGGFRCLTLYCDTEHWVLAQIEGRQEVELERFDFAEPWNLREPLDRERSDAFRGIVDAQRVALVHLRSFVATGPELVGVAKDAGAPVVCSVHDFYPVCPTIQLLDEQERYCAGHCTPGPGPCPTSKRWVGAQPDLKHDYVLRWRERVGAHLAGADAFVTTSHAAKDVLVDHFPFMDDGRFRLIEHGRDADRFRAVGVAPAGRPRVVAFGALGISKGTTLLDALLRIDEREGRAFEFHFVGPRHPRFTPEALGGVVHGEYGRGELPLVLGEIRPSFALITSIWPETYCHTLTEAWLADLPVFASDIGTLRERITRHGGGWLLDHTDPEAFYAAMRAASASPAEWHQRRDEIARIEPRTVDDMAADYRSLYRDLLRRRVTS